MFVTNGWLPPALSLYNSFFFAHDFLEVPNREYQITSAAQWTVPLGEGGGTTTVHKHSWALSIVCRERFLGRRCAAARCSALLDHETSTVSGPSGERSWDSERRQTGSPTSGTLFGIGPRGSEWCCTKLLQLVSISASVPVHSDVWVGGWRMCNGRVVRPHRKRLFSLCPLCNTCHGGTVHVCLIQCLAQGLRFCETWPRSMPLCGMHRCTGHHPPMISRLWST